MKQAPKTIEEKPKFLKIRDSHPEGRPSEISKDFKFRINNQSIYNFPATAFIGFAQTEALSAERCDGREETRTCCSQCE
jgi:hypothetical protein